MKKGLPENLLISIGIVFTFLGIYNLYFHFIKKADLILGDVLIRTDTTGFFLVIIGILSIILDRVDKK